MAVWEAHVCTEEAHGVSGFPTSSYSIFQHILQSLLTYPSYPVSLEHTLFFNLLDITVIFNPSPFPRIVT